MVKLKYEKNIDDIFTEKIQSLLLTKNISVIGCGGQGSYILDFLIRLGVKSISFWDGDSYEPKNLNRQLGCSENTIGKNKANILFDYLKDINNDTILNKCNWYFGDNREYDLNLLLNSDFIFYCADCYYNIYQLRKDLRLALMKGIPIIDCPVQKLGGYIFIDVNEDTSHYDFVTEQLIHQSESKPKNCSQPAYKCALIAAEAVNQMVQYFSNIRYACKNSELIIDIYHHKYIERDKYSIQ